MASQQKKPLTPADRILPHNNEAEDAVIASCLIDPDQFPNVRALIEPEDFFNEQAKLSFIAMDSLWPGIDQLTVYQATKGKVKDTYLSYVTANIPTSIHAEYYAGIVKELSGRRKLIDAANRISAMAYEDNRGSDLFLMAQEILNTTDTQKSEDIVNARQKAERLLTMANSRREKGLTGGLPFVYRDVEYMTGGMFPGNLVIIGARPGIGKSQILIEEGFHLRSNGYSTMVASAEMNLDEWGEREIAILTGVSPKEQRRGLLDSDRLSEAIDTISRWNDYWLGEPITISRICNKARVLKNTKGIDVLIVDYIQLIADTVSSNFGANIRERVGYISRTLKRLGKELDIVVIAAAQLNRDIESREDKRPRMSDLKESGDIEQDGDIIILLHRPSKYDPRIEPGITHLYIPKIRQIGDIADVRLLWKPEYSRHVDVTE